MAIKIEKFFPKTETKNKIKVGDEGQQVCK